MYYAILREATRSVILRRLCDQILHDELHHVRFQAQQLASLRSRRGLPGTALTMGLQRFLYGGTVIVVWMFHRRVMDRAGVAFPAWWRSCWREFEDAFSPETPKVPDAMPVGRLGPADRAEPDSATGDSLLGFRGDP